MNTEVYGLVSGPAWWRITFVGYFLQEGYLLNALDRCCLTLPGPVTGAPTRGVVMLEMDDVMSAGDAEHERRMEAIAKKNQKPACSTGEGGGRT